MGGEGGGLQKLRERWAARSAHPNSRGKLFVLDDSGTVVPLLTSAAAAPWRPSHAGPGGGGGFGMTPWCDDLVCSWRRLLADRHSLPFPWTLSLHRRWCPSASHHPLTFLFLPALTFPLPSPFPSLGGGGVGVGVADTGRASLPPCYSRATSHSDAPACAMPQAQTVRALRSGGPAAKKLPWDAAPRVQGARQNRRPCHSAIPGHGVAALTNPFPLPSAPVPASAACHPPYPPLPLGPPVPS